jgi:hypothetical protein
MHVLIYEWSPFWILLVICAIYILLRCLVDKASQYVAFVGLIYVFVWSVLSVRAGRETLCICGRSTHPTWLYIVRMIPILMYMVLITIIVLRMRGVMATGYAQILVDLWWVFPILFVIITGFAVARNIKLGEQHSSEDPPDATFVAYMTFLYPIPPPRKKRAYDPESGR